ncbi:hypothetical protein [Tenacibaculum ovolyticum]|uniref:hypothetical protein n=1 Tax=Tenacibaculum ovolyticum TaxID=104270 RepID=UPI0007EC37CB|nr:hypothetical protein [Tenacibaculum ovolyticum]
MRIIILLIGLLFFSCKTLQISKEYTINYSDITVLQSCDTYIYEINNKPLEGVYKIVYNKGYSITKFKKGIVQLKKGYIKNKLWYRRELNKQGGDVFIEYYEKKIPSFWSTSNSYDSIYTYSKKYPMKTVVFYEGNMCQYTFDYDASIGKLKINVAGCNLKYVPSALESAILNTKCKNNPLTYNTEHNEFNKKITVEILNPKGTVYIDYELKENEYSLKF